MRQEKQEFMNKYGDVFIGLPQKGNIQKYLSSIVFETIDDIIEFYNYLSNNDDTVTVMVAKGTLNYNYEIYLSLANTLESIQQLLKQGRMSDAFALIRKYNDAVILHTYTLTCYEKEKNSFFNENYSLYNNVINEWVNGRKVLIEKKKEEDKEQAYLAVIKERDKELYRLLINNNSKQVYGKLRSIENDNVHHNNWNAFRINDPHIRDFPISLSLLTEANEAIKLVFTIHFSYLILTKSEAMYSYDYIYALEEGITLDENTRDCAASIISEMFEKYIEKHSKKLADYLCSCTALELRG